MTRLKATVPALVLAAVFVLSVVVRTQDNGRQGPASLSDARQSIANLIDRDSEFNKIRIGFAISPVRLNLRHKNLALVGLGSYIVNAQADCAGCHSTPTYAEGGDPHLGQPEQISVATYLSGGGDLFGPFVPRNLTPNAEGKPANLTLAQFLQVMNTGADLKGREPFVPSADHDLLQVMPWPLFSKMTDREKRAIYEYLSAIPCIGSATRCGA